MTGGLYEAWLKRLPRQTGNKLGYVPLHKILFNFFQHICGVKNKKKISKVLKVKKGRSPELEPPCYCKVYTYNLGNSVIVRWYIIFERSSMMVSRASLSLLRLEVESDDVRYSSVQVTSGTSITILFDEMSFRT